MIKTETIEGPGVLGNGGRTVYSLLLLRVSEELTETDLHWV